jgi:hypothetical protein
MSFAGLPAYLFSAATGVVVVVSIASIAPAPRLVVPPAAERIEAAPQPAAAPAPAVLGPVTTGNPATIVVPADPPTQASAAIEPAPLPPIRPETTEAAAPETTGAIGLSALAPLSASEARSIATPVPRRAARSERIGEDAPRLKQLRPARAEAPRTRRERRRRRAGEEQGLPEAGATADVARPAIMNADPNARAIR